VDEVFPALGAVALGLAFGFSSTVFAAKVLEEKRELRGVHGRVAIGILIVQDVAAVVVLASLSIATPSGSVSRISDANSPGASRGYPDR